MIFVERGWIVMRFLFYRVDILYIYILQLQITCQLVFYFVLEQGKMAEVCDVFYVIQ